MSDKQVTETPDKPQDETFRAAHTDVEELAMGLDEMSQAAMSLGVELRRVSSAARMLRLLSQRLMQSEASQ